MIVLVGKSGCGKTSIERRLQKMGFSPIVSYTTREKRKGEIRGQAYNFVTRPDFATLERKGYFLETSTFNGNRYGAAKKDFTDNAVVVLDLNGLRVVEEYFAGAQALPIVSFFIEADEEELKRRMKNRGDSEDSILDRLEHDKREFSEARKQVTHVIQNDDLEESVERILSLYNKEIKKKETA